ncbi:hypothetical protein HYV79_00425 [Candidatus Woesearchaeota archaeon]|nr:hypothetical protein [Candidatus Woesearchaeota archaeon]
MQIKFNKSFDGHIATLKKGMVVSFIEWCQRCKDNKELGSVPSRKEYKHLYIFFRKIASDVRAVLIKEQNNNFIEIILDNHKCYDDTRIKYGYKKSSYYGS